MVLQLQVVQFIIFMVPSMVLLAILSEIMQNANHNAFGGAIDNYGTIGNITGHFIGNYAETTNNQSQGGAIYSAYNTKIGDITGDFVGNYASGQLLKAALFPDFMVPSVILPEIYRQLC